MSSRGDEENRSVASRPLPATGTSQQMDVLLADVAGSRRARVCRRHPGTDATSRRAAHGSSRTQPMALMCAGSRDRAALRFPMPSARAHRCDGSTSNDPARISSAMTRRVGNAWCPAGRATGRKCPDRPRRIKCLDQQAVGMSVSKPIAPGCSGMPMSKSAAHLANHAVKCLDRPRLASLPGKMS